MPTNKVLDILLNGDCSSADGWTLSSNTTHDTSHFDWASDGTALDVILQQSVIGLVAGNTYKVYLTASNTSFAATDTYVGVQLAGGTAYRLTENQVFNAANPLYLVAGSSLESGLEITAVNGTADDTMTIDSVSVIVEQFTPSTNLDSVFVSGNLRVPAGSQVLLNNDFADWAVMGEPDDWGLVGVGDLTNYVFETGTSGITFNMDGSIANALGIISDVALTVGKEYLLSYTVTRDDEVGAEGGLEFLSGTDVISSTSGINTTTVQFIATSTDFSIVTQSSQSWKADIDISIMTLYELTDGPIDEYESSGTLNGKTKYTSVNTHADGAGGADQEWDLWWDNSTDWVVSLVAGTLGTNYFDRTGSSQIGADYSPNGNATGTATVTNGPTDHSIATGSPGLETDGVSGYINLKTSYDYLNGIRDGKFAIVSVHKKLIETGNTERIFSSETSSGIGLSLRFNGADDQYLWSGTNALSERWPAGAEIKSTVLVSDIGVSDDIWVLQNGAIVDTSLLVNGLDVCMSSLLRSGATAYAGTGNLKAKFGFTAILDLSVVATVDATFSTGLSEAINAAAVSSNYDATAIANAIMAVDAGITGVYYPLNEASGGDASSKYILARDITDDSEMTSEFYGLVSPAGVTGVRIAGFGGRLNGVYRPRYKNNYRAR